MKEIKGIEGHIVLYCKGHYKSTGKLVEDLKKIWAIRCGYKYNKEDNTIVKYIADELYRILYPTIKDYIRFQEQLHEYLLSWFHKELDTHEKVIYFYCSELANLQIKDKVGSKWKYLIKLPKPKKQVFNRILRGNGRYEDYELINN